MKAEAIKFRFISPIHLGKGNDNLDKSETIYHSDSLKSAIYAVGLPHFPEWKDEARFFDGFAISSCFPFSGNEYFLPKPMIHKQIRFGKTDDAKSAKKGKKIAFFSKSHFENFINPKEEGFRIEDELITPDGAFVCADPFTALSNFFTTEISQRVSVPNEASDETETKPFYADRIYFTKDCGLYFIVKFENSQLRSQILKTLKLLGESGIGTDRTIGNGLFDFDERKDVSDFELKEYKVANMKINLGLYLPTLSEHGEIDFNNSAWGFTKRGGYLAGAANEKHNSLRKKSIYLFNEGSVFASAESLVGKYENLKPEWNNETDALHPIWRDGKSLFITI